MTSQKLQKLVTDTYFGTRYLEKQASQMSISIQIKTEIGHLDRIGIGLSKTGLVIVIIKPDTTLVYTATVTYAGQVEMKSHTTNLKCSFTHATNDTVLSNRADKCRFCSKFGVIEYTNSVDKFYPVFFQNWIDRFDVLWKGIRVVVTIQHQDVNGYGWGFREMGPIVCVERYGMLVPSYISDLIQQWETS